MKNLYLSLVAGLALTASLLPARAWNAEGHMVVAQYAYDHLTPTAKAACDQLSSINVFGVDTSNNSFVTSAAWADDIKSFTSAFSSWHFIDIPISLDGTSTNSFVIPTANVVWAISNCVVALQNPSTSISNQAVNLRFLVHFAGDIHQPLHSSTGISAAHPGGDSGGNSFTLSGSPNNLHSLWDEGAFYLADPISRPLTAGGQTTLNNKVADVESAYPYSVASVSIPDSMKWAVESWGLAKTVCYSNITEGGSPSAGYLSSGQATSKQRMAVAGQRLADLLNALFTTNTFAGNGKTDFGGPIGQGSLTLSDDGINVYGTITRGSGNFNDNLVLYIDSVAGGFTSTLGFADTADGLRSAISRYDGTHRSVITNASGFLPDYAIAIGPGKQSFGGLWRLANGGSNSLQFSNSINLTPLSSNAATYTFSFPLTSIGLVPGAAGLFRFIGTYVSDTGFRSTESFAGSISGTLGWNPFTNNYIALYQTLSLPRVTSTSDSGSGSLRGVIASTGPGFTVVFDPSLSGQSIVLSSGAIPLNRNITINGATLSSGVQISGSRNSSLFIVTNGVTATLNSLTLTNGAADSGGAIYNSGTLTLNQCTLAGNFTTGSALTNNGGAIYNEGTLFLNECTLATNAALSNIVTRWTFEGTVPVTAGPYGPEIGTGSALGFHAGTATYSSPSGNGSSHSFSVNTWSLGDYWQFSVGTLIYSNVSLNWDQTSSSTGPRDFTLQYSTDGANFLNYTNYTVLGNGIAPNLPWSATNTSGAYHYSFDLSGLGAVNNANILYFRLKDSSTTSVGGGTVAATGTDRVDNFTLAYGGLGGAIFSTGGLTVKQSTISQNAAVGGAGIRQSAGSFALTNSIVASNTPDNYGGVFTGVGNLVSGNPLLGTLTNNGGLTPTMLPLTGSPAIDGCTSGTIFLLDQRGLARVSGSFADIGAVETQTVTASSSPKVFAAVQPGGSSLKLTFTNLTGVSFHVYGASNPGTSFNNWSLLGAATESPAGSGQYQFTDSQFPSNTRRFYRVVSP